MPSFHSLKLRFMVCPFFQFLRARLLDNESPSGTGIPLFSLCVSRGRQFFLRTLLIYHSPFVLVMTHMAQNFSSRPRPKTFPFSFWKQRFNSTFLFSSFPPQGQAVRTPLSYFFPEVKFSLIRLFSLRVITLSPICEKFFSIPVHLTFSYPDPATPSPPLLPQFPLFRLFRFFFSPSSLVIIRLRSLQSCRSIRPRTFFPSFSFQITTDCIFFRDSFFFYPARCRAPFCPNLSFAPPSPKLFRFWFFLSGPLFRLWCFLFDSLFFLLLIFFFQRSLRAPGLSSPGPVFFFLFSPSSFSHRSRSP